MAEPTFVSASTINGGTDGTQSGSYDVGTGTDRTLAICIGIYDSASTGITADTITYNGVSATLRKTNEYIYAGTRSVTEWIYTLDNPASGSNTWVVTMSEGTNNFFIGLAHWTGANNGVGPNTAETEGNLSDHEYDITGTDADGVYIQVGMLQAERTITAGTGTTVRTEDGGSRFWVATESSSGGTDTVGVTVSSAARSSSCIIELLPSGGAAGATVDLNTLTLAGTAVTASITAGAVSTLLDVLTLVGSTPSLSVTPGAVTAALNVLTLSGSVEGLSVTPGAVSTSLNTLTITATAETITIISGGLAVTLNTLTLSSTLESLTVSPGAVSTLLNALTLTGSAESITVSILSGIVVTLNTLTLTGSPEAITIAPGAISTLLDVLTLAGSVQSLTAVPGGVAPALDTLSLVSSLESISITPGEISVMLDTLTLASTINDISLGALVIIAAFGTVISPKQVGIVIMPDQTGTVSMPQQLGTVITDE